MNRRRFSSHALHAIAASVLPGCGLGPRVDEVELAASTPAEPEPSPAIVADLASARLPPLEVNPVASGVSELDGDFPDWTLGDASASVNTMLMFRGNPTHTFYGTGPLREQPELLWRKPLGDYKGTRADGTQFRWAGTGWTGQAVRWGARIYVGAVDAKFYCFDANTGEQRWRFDEGGMYKSSCCFYDGRVYVGNVDNKLRCLDARNGNLVWTYATGRDCDSSPCVAGGRLYVGGEDGKLKCLDPADAALHWELPLGEGIGAPRGSGGIESSPAVADGEVYVGHYDGYLTCVDANTGEQRWRASTGGDTDVSPVVVGDLVYVAAETGSPCLRAFDRTKRGALVWEFESWRGFWSTPAVVGDRLYIGGHDGVMYCLAADSGAVIWTFRAQASIWCSPAVVDGKVAFGSHDPFFYLLDAQTGALLWKHEIGGRTHSSPCIVDGRIHVGSTNGYFHCFG
jgi:eukaryotic-like serine/threonine-protein kinase